MNTYKIVQQYCILFFLLCAGFSCKKYLNAKPDQQLVIPATVADLQSVLDYSNYMNTKCSEAGELASDNYYLTDATYGSLRRDVDRKAYLWQPGQFTGISPDDWANEYNVVYNANVVLDNLGNISKNSVNSNDWNLCKGMALVLRGKSFYEIAQIWAKAYDSSSANSDLGIPLRLTSNFNIPSLRSTVKETYAQILQDLQSAVPLLPVNPPSFPYRTYRAAAFGYLARTYLSMRNYNLAKLYADSCLMLNNNLLDYNTVSSAPVYPFASIRFTNPEDIFHTNCSITNFGLVNIWGSVDSLLYASYDSNDLRKSLYFKKKADGSISFVGSYDGTLLNYNGIATDEMYLVRAECSVREGFVGAGINDLNTLLSMRWKAGTFIPENTGNADTALSIILTERRKELLYRTLRFTDIKRLNKEGANITLKRIIAGQTYTLMPNDPRFALPIPDDVIKYTGMQQN